MYLFRENNFLLPHDVCKNRLKTTVDLHLPPKHDRLPIKISMIMCQSKH